MTSTDTMLFKNESGHIHKIRRPDWAKDPDLVLTPEAVEKFNNAELVLPPRLEFEGDVLNADIVPRGEGDLIFHFHGIKHSDFRTLLAEVVEAHFGSTNDFRVDRVIEMPGTWGLLAKDVRKKPMFSLKFYAEEFLWLLDKVLKETR